jgi:hypothetical protein
MRQLFLLAALVAAAPVHAADTGKVERLVGMIHIQESMAQMQTMFLTNTQQQMMSECLAQGDSQERCASGSSRMMVPLKHAFDQAFNWNDISKDIIALYAQKLTDKEVDAALAYYATPEGQSMLAKLPELMQQGSEIGKRRMQAVAPQMKAEMDAVRKQLQDEDKAAAAATPTDAPAAPASSAAPASDSKGG